MTKNEILELAIAKAGSQVKLADYLKISSSHMSHIMSGRTLKKHAITIAEFLTDDRILQNEYIRTLQS